ncbi:arthrodial cuticle protein AMP8.1 [Penaeus vannamei]|uniref:Arthrodial cuticle protein AMP8.1 n=1 Tax=Penaeus vannamei TaxID=6689 RepID=A0A3R7QNI2_PENVA|nr:arthrodial cuticle protein AMP8.1 [Penaeus vannamei]
MAQLASPSPGDLSLPVLSILGTKHTHIPTHERTTPHTPPYPLSLTVNRRGRHRLHPRSPRVKPARNIPAYKHTRDTSTNTSRRPRSSEAVNLRTPPPPHPPKINPRPRTRRAALEERPGEWSLSLPPRWYIKARSYTHHHHTHTPTVIMKSVIFACLFAVALAAPQQNPLGLAEVLVDERVDNGDGTFQYNFQTSNDIAAQRTGSVGSAGQSNTRESTGS